MFKKINIIMVCLIFVLAIGAVSANDDANATDMELSTANDDVAINEISDEAVSASNSHTVTVSNYYSYFDNKGNFISSTAETGDTIYLDGTFTNLKFTFSKQVNIVGTSSNNMKNSVVTLLNGASGSTISNLHILNTNANTMGVFLNNADNCTVKNCFINNTGMASHCIAVANGADYNSVVDNTVSCYGVTYGHGGTRSTTPLIVSGSHHNYIANNWVESDDANGIYLSDYNHDPIKGGVSNFNTIYNNTVHYNVLPTSWSYGIQVMGGNNIIRSNTVIGGYRGVSTSSGENNTIIENYVINITGADFNHLGVEVGGEYAIVGTPHSIIANNTIIGAKIIATGAGISVIDHSIVENNFVNVTNAGKGIGAGGSNVIVKNNIIYTESGSGIHEKDEGSGLLVQNNTITSISGTGILIEKLSSKRMPSNVTIIENTISTGNKNAIDASGVQANTSYIDLKSNKIIGSGNIVSPAGSFDTSKPMYIFNGTTHYITPDNIRDYINSNGGLGPEINDGDIINFEGTFSNEIIFVTKSIKITGKDPVFLNSSFKVTALNAWIENLNIINKEDNRVNSWGIFVNQGFGVKIINNTIKVTDPKASYAIYVLESTFVEVSNNNLFSEGTYLTYTLLSYASENCEFYNNTIYTIGTDEVHAYEPKKCLDGEELNTDVNVFCLDGGHIVPEIYRTYGILMLYSSNNNVSGNYVNVTSRLKENYPTAGANSSTNSLVGIDLYYNSHNNTFSNNNVYVSGMDNYIYGMGVLGVVTGHTAPEGQGATNNSFIANNITLVGNYFATGIIAGEESKYTIMENNTINSKSDGVVYGITLEMSQMSTIVGNDLKLSSQVIYGIDFISSSGNIISSNNILSNAKTSCAVLFSNANNNIVSQNIIFSNGTGEELGFVNLDFISCKNSGIYLTANSTNNNIVSNNVTSATGHAILVDDVSVGNVISDNYLISKEGNGNEAISNTDGNTVSQNYQFTTSISYDDIKVNYLGTAEFILIFSDDADGGIVKLYDADANYVGESIVTNGVANLKYVFDDSYVPSQYLFTAEFTKDSFKTTECKLNFEIIKGNVIISLDNITMIQGDSDTIIAVVLDEFGNPISDVNVQFSRKNSAGVIRSIGVAKTNDEGIAALNYTAQSSLGEGQHDIYAQINDMDNYNGANVSSTLTVLSRLDTIITINDKVYFGGVLATLKDSNGNAIVNKKVTVKIADTSYPVISNEKGEIILPENVKGSYDVNVTSSAEGRFNEGIATLKTTILPIITGNKAYSVYYGNTVKYKVRILDSNGNPVSKGKSVKFTVKGQTKTIRTDANGYATYSVKLKAGAYTISAEYNGCKVSNKITFKPTLIAKNIVKKKAKTTKFTVKLVNKNGKILKNKKITFKIKGKKYSAKTNKKGVATLSIKNLKVGKFTITSSYGGCTVKKTIQIKK